ncbi:MAG TPA: alpha/beta hydrolase [Candidatus Limnocylindria bacterium]|nr:alpha/beta hydrolase [Candidatus Limnocylindria bacterium]
MATLRDGRAVAYAEWGDLGGRPVVLFHGSPGSRLLCPDGDATAALGVRLITVDRPGYGRSDPDPDHSLQTWADDYAEFQALLGLPPCPVVGWSGGGPYALACAVRTPALVTSIGLAASRGPLDDLPDGWSAKDRSLAELLRRDPAAALEAITNSCQWYADDPASMFADGWGGPDDALLSQSNVRQTMIESEVEGARQGLIGLVADQIAKFEPWGFSIGDVSQGVRVWVGGADDPRVHNAAEYFIATIPRATLVTYEDSGHLLTIPHWAEMLTWLH